MVVSRKTAVIIEDDADTRYILGKALDRLGYKVRQAAQGEVGLEQVARYKPDLVCIDLSLPGMSGFEVCEAIRIDPQTRHIRILIISGRSLPQDQYVAELFGADGYLIKPFSINTFNNAVMHLVGQIRSSGSSTPEVSH